MNAREKADVILEIMCSMLILLAILIFVALISRKEIFGKIIYVLYGQLKKSRVHKKKCVPAEETAITQ